MKTINHYLFFSLISIFLVACSVKSAQITDSKDQTQILQALMTGTFDSSEQAERDTNYYNISLQMYPIWKNRPGTWLYVEQALASMQDKPYRQRVYKLEKRNDNVYASRVYTLKNAKEAIGQWENPLFFDQFDTEILEEREGCAVYLKMTDNGSFTGSTRKTDCSSTLRGASYATSEVSIFKGKIISWDQGFDAEGKQVWGATQGGYIFKK